MSAPSGWHPLALGADLAPGTVAGTRLFGRELAVWRDAAGVAQVWEDRCPHRGMRLSFGFVRGGRLACLYHGWQFDGDGRCRFIPAHPGLDVPASITVARERAVERNGIVWMATGAADPTEAPGPADGGTPVRSLTIDAPADRVAAALDGAHWVGALATLVAGPDRVHAALQAVAPDRACLHLLLASRPAQDDTPAARARVSRWAQALRDTVEAESCR